MILWATNGEQTAGNGLLADVQVQEAADLALLIEVGCFFLEAANQRHFVIKTQQFLLVKRFYRDICFSHCKSPH